MGVARVEIEKEWMGISGTGIEVVEVKPNPKEATTRNIQASNKRDKALLDRIKELERRVSALEKKLKAWPR